MSGRSMKDMFDSHFHSEEPLAASPLEEQLMADIRARRELKDSKFSRPVKTRIFTTANQKGGVGKTTSTVNLAVALAEQGLRVLVLDMDPQGNASTALGIEHSSGTPSIYDVLINGSAIVDVVQKSPEAETLHVVPATIDLSGAEIELVDIVSRETVLRSALHSYLELQSDQYDYVFFDCPPSLGLLTLNGFVAATEVLIPIQCEYYALEGLSQLLKTVELVSAALNSSLSVTTILLTMYDSRTNLAQQVAAEVREHFPSITLETEIPRSVRVSEAPSFGRTVITHEANSSGALAYKKAAFEINSRN